MDLPQLLHDIGFDDQEATVYLNLLQQGKRSQQEIADGTGILRQTVYDIIRRMEHKGLVATATIGRRNFFEAVEPKLLLSKLKEKEDAFAQALPELERLRAKDRVELYSQSFIGMAGLKNLFNLTFDAKTELLWLCNKRIVEEVFKQYYWHNYAQKRTERGIPIRLLVEPKIALDKHWRTDKKVLRETRTLQMVRQMQSSFVVFDDKVILFSLDAELFGVFIQNRVIADSYRQIFEEFWKLSKLGGPRSAEHS